MKRRYMPVYGVLLLLLAVPCSAAEKVVETWRGGGAVQSPVSVSVNSTDGSCWVADLGPWTSGGHVGSAVVHFAADGSVLWRGESFNWPVSVAAYPSDGSCWVADTYNHQVVHLASNGTEMWRGGAFDSPVFVAVDPFDGSCWVADQGHWDEGSYSQLNSAIVHLAADGTELSRGTPFADPTCLAVNPNDGSCWAASWGDSGPRAAVAHYAADGTKLWQSPAERGYFGFSAIAVNPIDNSCWVGGDTYLVHLAADGRELSQAPEWYSGPSALAVDPFTGIVWEGCDLVVRRLSPEGSELSLLGGYNWPRSIALNVTDGSAWVADAWNGQVVHLAVVPGANFVGTPTSGAAPLTVAFVDYSSNAPTSWAWDFGDGTTSTRRDPLHTYTAPGLYSVQLVATGPDGSDTDLEGGYITVGFPDTDPDSWAFRSIIACADAGIVTGFADGAYHPNLAVTRGQMAAYLARALCGGDDLVPSGPAQATFSDVDAGYWAYRHIEYCAAHGVANGYADGRYQPTWTVNRGQMAAFLARAMVGGEEFIPTRPVMADFSDVPVDFAFFQHIQYLYRCGVTTGYADGAFHPEWACNREQMAAFVARAFHLLP